MHETSRIRKLCIIGSTNNSNLALMILLSNLNGMQNSNEALRPPPTPPKHKRIEPLKRGIRSSPIAHIKSRKLDSTQKQIWVVRHVSQFEFESANSGHAFGEALNTRSESSSLAPDHRHVAYKKRTQPIAKKSLCRLVNFKKTHTQKSYPVSWLCASWL